jgi:malate dehydrogenase (NAD) (EC 1.1.1.37)
MKVSVIGAGNVGGTLAQRIVEADVSDVVLLDVMAGIPQGKAYDLCDARSILEHDRNILGTQDYKDIAGSDVVVVTAGLARQPGMTREDLLKKNVSIIKEVVANIKKHAPETILIMVTNPLDILTNVALKESGFPSRRVMGMGGVLDSSRFANLVAGELKVAPSTVEAMVIAAHGQGMLPLARLCRVNGKPLTELVSQERCEALTKLTVDRGAQIVSCLGKGSAYYAPAAAAFSMVKAILNDEKTVVPACALCNGEYGIKGVCIGVPVRLGRQGIEKVVELQLSKEELAELKSAAESVRKAVEGL